MGRKWNGEGRHRKRDVCALCDDTERLTIWRVPGSDEERTLCMTHLLKTGTAIRWGV